MFFVLRDSCRTCQNREAFRALKNVDATKFPLDLPDAFRPKLCCVSVETDNRSARSGHPFRAERIREIKQKFRHLKLFFFQHELFSLIVFRRFSRLTTKPHREAVFSGFSPEGVSKSAHPLFLCQIGHQKKDVQLSDGRFGVKAIVSLRLLYSDFFGIRVPLPGCGVEHYNFGRGSHHLYLRLVGDPYGLAAQVSGCQTLNLRIAQ